MNEIKWWTYRTNTCSAEEIERLTIDAFTHEFIFPTEPFNEVYKGIYIADETTAKNIELLKRLRITHILNAAHGNDPTLDFVDTSQEFYSEYGIEYLGVEAIDITSFNLLPYFERAADFIENCLMNAGQVLVHCQQGISRSSTLVLSYLMIKEKMTVEDAMKTVIQCRQIKPNEGFIKQLCVLNDILYNKSN